MLSKIGRKKAIILGLFVMSCSTVLFGASSYLKSKWTFYSLSMFGRMVQGVADSMICVAIPSVVAIEFPYNSERY